MVQQFDRLPQISFVATTVGRYDLMCSARITDITVLTTLVHSELMAIDGVRRVNTSFCLEQVQHQVQKGFVL
jgi:DNA-binding Lrp family transcriptional regulator